jgi:hypothetical protein
MSINKIYLKDLKELKKDYNQDPEKFKNRMIKADALIGPIDSISWVEKIMKK